MTDEGVIKFASAHDSRPVDGRRLGTLCCKLVAWREIMAKTQLVGQDPARYGGAGYGNVSARVGAPSSARGARSMLITGTQTSGLDRVGIDDFCVVERYDYRRNQVVSHGRRQPSSESMTHGAVYDISPHIRFVFHAHSPMIWRRAAALRIPTTDPRIAYGTSEMALAVQELYLSSALSEVRILAMGGHEDGVMVFGHSAEEAGQVLLTYLARSFENQCLVGGR
jgi:ribulose-5-phosphate 4-epimerase/fuculose-1-phosphate aldolase